MAGSGVLVRPACRTRPWTIMPRPVAPASPAAAGLAPKWWTVASAPDVAPFSAEFRHQAVLLTRSKGVPVTHVARELGIRIDSLRDWIAQARHDPRQLHEGTLCETVPAELVRLRADNQRLLRNIAILRDALRIVASEGISAERGRR